MLAKRMDGLRYRVFAGCLFPNGEGAKDLANNSSSDLTIIPLDVTNDKSVDLAKDFVMNNLGADVLWAVVNNAGIGQGGEIDWTSLSEFQNVIEVNTFGVIRVTKAFLPLLRKSKGRVVNITSLLGKVCLPGLVGYCMSKSAAISFTTGLRMEMTKWKVKVISIEPFFYTTPLTKTKPAIDLLEKVWAKTPTEIRKDYGEAYKEVIKNACVNLLARASHKTYEVLDCFEDAITAKEPLTTYSPCYLPDKLGFQLLGTLPSTVTERYILTYLDTKVKPAALMKKEATTASAKEK
ncbi:retinol dehydrogenase 5-like [Stegodyphus dumicola]|uniref:retinol dehydrogenase 5-like n=1 Tax=Stegodyphus dumicola TaxID=202533 RepID=UPI0015AD1A17|nr:retinol dehydrogenase 5-like [Stegodyphus dumicola]